MNKSFMVCLLIASAGLAAQEPERPSVAEAARKAREKKADQPKATKVYDNQSLEKGKPSSPKSASPAPEPKPARPAPVKATSELEREYRIRFANLRIQLFAAEAQGKALADTMAKYSPTSVTVEHYYYDPKKLKELQSAIDTNTRRVADLKKQLADLEEELRRKGLPSGWAL
jgi:hypothetical protein